MGDGRSSRGGRAKRTTVMGAALAAAVLLAGCGSDDGTATLDDAGSAHTAGAPELAEADLAPQAAGDAGAGTSGPVDAAVGDAVARATTGVPAGRALARTARLEVRVADVEQAAARIRALVARVGGFVADAEVRGGEHPFGVLTLRVPATELDAAVAEVGELAEEVVLQQIGTEDLTDQLTDTSTRIANLTALEAELRALLAEVRERTSSAQELLVVFNQVNDVRLQVERLEAQRAAIEDRVALATITVDLQPVAVTTVVEPEPEPSTVALAWEATRAAFGRMGDALVWLAVTVVPVGLALAVPAVLLLLALRRAVTALWRRGSLEPTTPAAAAD